MTINLVLALFAGSVLVLSAFSTLMQRLSLPGPVLALLFGVLIGPYALGVMKIEDFGVPTGTLLEETSRITLAIGLTGVALRLPHGYWRRNLRWVAVIILLGMLAMLVIATGVLWALLGIPFLTALLIGAIVTPTDPVVTTPIVTGSLAEERVPERVRHNLSSESGINDGLGYLFVMLPILLLTKPGEAWQELLTKVLLWEVMGAAVFGIAAGFLLARLFVWSKNAGLMEESAYLGFFVPFGLLILGAGKLLGTDAILAVFIAAAVFGQFIPERDEEEQDRIDDAIARLFLLPIFILLGLALPLGEWVALGWIAPIALAAAVLVRRIITLWSLRPLIKSLHDVPETAFLSWFGPVGVSALFYTTLAERLTGNHEIFVYTTLAITLSVLIHGLTTASFSSWLKHKEPGRKERHEV